MTNKSYHREPYQQIVRDFADQPAATQARARLAALKQSDRPSAPATMTQRKIETPSQRMGPGDTDGHHAVYLNNATGELIYGDLAGKSKRVIFRAKLDDLPGWAPSRDFSMVMLQFDRKPSRPSFLAVLRTDGTGYREIAKFDGRPDCGPYWSWDNRYFLCRQPQEATSRLLRISVADGQVRELLHLQAGEVTAATFSPDGRFVAYEVLSSAANPVSRIFVRSSEGGEPQLIYEEPAIPYLRYFQHHRLLDWTTDGRYLAIASERTGKGALHLLPIKDGKSAGPAVFIKYGDFEEGTATADGRLIYKSAKPGGVWTIYIASLDSNSRSGAWKSLDLNLGNKLNPSPQWSSDSNRIAYVATNEDAGQSGSQVVHVHNLSSGEDRELYRGHGLTACSWAVQEPKLFCADTTAEKTDILSVTVDSGAIERLHAFPASLLYIVYPSRDDRALYLYNMLAGNEVGGKLLRWEIATQRETTLEQFSPTAYGTFSSDERWLIREDTQEIDIRPTSGGDWKPLVSLPIATGHFNTTPDGNWLFYHGIDPTGKHSLFRVATVGGQPERLGDFPTTSRSGTLEISPDGSKIMVAAGEYETGYEFWSLENFVRPAPNH